MFSHSEVHVRALRADRSFRPRGLVRTQFQLGANLPLTNSRGARSPYDWVMHWLAKQPAWSQSREFEITTRDPTKHGGAVCEEEPVDTPGMVEDDDDDQLVHGKRKRQVAFMPSLSAYHRPLDPLIVLRHA